MSIEISTEQLEVITKAAVEEFQKIQREEALQRENKRLYNAKVLLHNYRRLNLYRKKVQSRTEDEQEADSSELISSESIDIESIKKSTQKTLAIMNFIDDMLHVYELNCSRSNDETMIRQYRTLYYYYIADDRKTYVEIAELLYVSDRTVRNDLQRAVKEMAILFFGVDGLTAL